MCRLVDDQRRLVVSKGDGTTAVWDLAVEEAHPVVTLADHCEAVSRVAFSLDGRYLSTAGLDGTVNVWDVEASVAAGTGLEVLTLVGRVEGLTDVAYGPDGSRLATASPDGTMRIYTLNPEELIALARSRLTRSLTEEECRQFLHLAACPQE